MSRSTRTEVTVGGSILFSDGPRVVVALEPGGYRVRNVQRVEEFVSWAEIGPARSVLDGAVDAVSSSLGMVVAAMDDLALQEALDKLEVVMILDTGYASGHASLARPGEPYTDFLPSSGLSKAQRFQQMARVLAAEAEANRRAQRAHEDGRPTRSQSLGQPSAKTLSNWHARYHRHHDGGFYGLIDGRRMRAYTAFDSLDPRLRQVADDVVARLDGTRSTVSLDELFRQTRVQILKDGLDDLPLPQATVRSYLSAQQRVVGSTARANKSNALRGVQGASAYPALRPGQVVAIDVTRADNFVIDDLTGRAISVEIITALDVCTRVVLALRVVPKSATSTEAALLLYDVLRPFSQAVSPDRVDDWRWAGVPQEIAEIGEAVARAEQLSQRPLIGEHAIPGLLPESIRSDRGSIFLSAQFRALCDHLDITLIPSRGRKPTDNAFIERWHETLQRCLGAVSGLKGRNVSQRGSDAGKVEYDPHGRAVFKGQSSALTARQLEVRLREFVATDYHRTQHTGIVIADRVVGEDTWMQFSPLECFDVMLAATGRLSVLQKPDLLYDFLPVKWGTIRHDGIEFHDLTYDSPALDDYRVLPSGYFHDGDRKAPFYYDPRDVSRLWFRDPHTQQIHEIPWRRAFQLQAPLTEVMARRAKSLARRRHADGARITKKAIQNEILEIINDIGDIERLRATPEINDWKVSAIIAANMRVRRSQYDHAEAYLAHEATITRSRGPIPDPGRELHPTAPAPAAPAEVSTVAVHAEPRGDIWAGFDPTRARR